MFLSFCVRRISPSCFISFKYFEVKNEFVATNKTTNKTDKLNKKTLALIGFLEGEFSRLSRSLSELIGSITTIWLKTVSLLRSLIRLKKAVKEWKAILTTMNVFSVTFRMRHHP